MKLELDGQYLAIQAEARSLARAIEPLAVEADEMSEVHPGVLAALRESGLSTLMVPAEHGGRLERPDPLAICLVREALMATSAHADSLFALQGIGSYAITVAGTERQRADWLPRVAACEALPAFALTEPDSGSDLKSVATRLSAEGDGLLLEGSKSFISNAGAADFYVVFAREGDAYSMVLVPADAAGLSITATPELIAPHVLGEMRFEQVRLPPEARLGAAGQGLELVMATLGVFRVSVAGAAVGLAQAALDEAVRHTRTRIQFGRPLARLGPVAQMLADCWTEIEMARLLTYRAASMAVEDPATTLPHSSMAKLAASEMAGRVVDRCVQMMGRFGLIRNARIERLYRQARPMRIYEGASEVLRLGIAAELTRQSE
ncbi:MAG: acyl-CoA dehydrogenase [Xanthomonadales bacterium]|nr:acyl-CoA dehydrogenase [Xanthomonadales bacterium]NIN58678.1 acyl-CoA dehydrogenase [Xanthomonadales bacterium]NIN74528.1 acyl-CoA dehydrogenase [Xanthomonadales bacterium]NIO14833.1 acyl-CoA dehydrogenase [Xanthomonadales bacterium]NIP11071.1 acyl-CoA dehydrogenase [Xanthomonadales bacterium]